MATILPESSDIPDAVIKSSKVTSGFVPACQGVATSPASGEIRLAKELNNLLEKGHFK